MGVAVAQATELTREAKVWQASGRGSGGGRGL